MNEERIIKEMKELETKIGHKFNNILILAKAMKSEKIEVPNSGKNHREYSNEAMATVGDAILKAVIADRLLRESPGITKGELTVAKKVFGK